MTSEEQKARVEETRELARELRKYKYMLNHSFIQAGKVLHEIKVGKRYQDLGCKSLKEFLADAEYGMPVSTAYLYMTLYEYYVLEKKISETDLMDLELIKLRAMLPVLKAGGDIEDWFARARTLGKGDFYRDIAEATGKSPADILPAEPDEDEYTVIDSTYVQIVKGSPCSVCGARPVDAHHFPQTKGAGALEERVIPLCRGCHIAFHQNPKEFFWVNRIKIMGFFYYLIDILIKEASNSGSDDSDIQDIPMPEVQEHDSEPEGE